MNQMPTENIGFASTQLRSRRSPESRHDDGRWLASASLDKTVRL